MSESVIKIEKDEGTITITMDGDNFVIEAARTRPKPLVDTLIENLGAGARSVWSNPTDSTIPWWFAGAVNGVFDSINPSISSNAKEIRQIIFTLLSANKADFHIALKMMLIYYNTQARGQLLTQISGRFIGGRLITTYIYSLGGRIPWWVAAPVGFAQASVGAMIRTGTKMWQISRRAEDHSVYPLLHSVITGDNRIIDLEREIGVDTYFKLRSYLRVNPEAILLQDEELKVAMKVIDKVFEYFQDPNIIKQWEE